MKFKKNMKRIGALMLSASLLFSGMTFGSMAEEATPTDMMEMIATCNEEPATDNEEFVPDESPQSEKEEAIYSVETELVATEETAETEETDAIESIPDDASGESESEESIDVTETPDVTEEPSETETPPVDDTAPDAEQAEEPVNQDETDPAEDEPSVPEDVSGDEKPSDEEQEPEPDEPEVEDETEDEPVKCDNALLDAINTDGHSYALSYGVNRVYEDKALTKVLYTTEDGWHIWLATAVTDEGSVKVYALDEEDKVIAGYIPDGNLDEEPITDEDVLWLVDEYENAKANTSIGMMTLFTVIGMWAKIEQPADDPVPDDEPATDDSHHPGDYIFVSTSTRVFLDVDNTAMTEAFPDLLQGCFTKKATVQIQTVEEDGLGNTWYCVRYLYGDDFANGTIKWTATGSVYVLASETTDTTNTSLTVTDYAYTKTQLQTRSVSALFTTTAMNGFTLKNINGSIGSFTAWQSGLYGSSGKDSAYPQIAKSAAHGTIYATPHYLNGFTVYCLEHNLSGPGEGSGSSQTAKGPYVLVDMDTFVNNPDAGGVNGIQYKAKTMHALAWVLRHTYPFMVLNRSDSNNEVWSRVAGQFAMREVIKQLEGSQYVRSYWDMDNFYSFSGGAPGVYLEYARWLATNGIARSKITGKITAKNQSLTISGTNFVGKVTLTTDADLIRIPKSAGTVSGHSGGSDKNYYYVKSGDTISITSSTIPFSVSMESISSSDEEACFLVGVPSVTIQKILVPIDGEPYPLQGGTLKFELKLGEIKVTKKSTDGILLPGTVFELLSSAGKVIQTATTDKSGVVVFESLEPGQYTIREKTAPQGYSISATSSQNVTVSAGSTSPVTFKNARITGKIRIVKKDSKTNKPLPGATFTVTRLSGPESDNASDIGQVVATITTNADGIAETGLLPWGEYRITETGVPDGYLDDSYTTTTWIK